MGISIKKGDGEKGVENNSGFAGTGSKGKNDTKESCVQEGIVVFSAKYGGIEGNCVMAANDDSEKRRVP